MTFANPWGLLALAALPAIVVLHLYQRRFPPLLIGGLHLWGAESDVRRPGRKRERLPITASLLLELLAAALFALVLSRPRFDESRGVEHLVVVLDNSASMQARPPGAGSFRDAAVDEIERRFSRLGRGAVATLIAAGRRPTILAGPAVELKLARGALESWNPSGPSHDLQPSWDLAAQIADQGARILFVTDHLPPKELAAPKAMEIVSVGRPLENAAVTGARWSFDSKRNKGRIDLRVGNFGRRPADVHVRGWKVASGATLFERVLLIEPGGDAALAADVNGGLSEIGIEIGAADDGLAIDNRVTLVEPKVRLVTFAITLGANHSAVRPIRRALSGIQDLQPGSARDAQLVFGSASESPALREDLWWLGIGPIDASETARQGELALAGPYLLEKSHPLLDGVLLSGVVFGGVQPNHFDATPLVCAGRHRLLARLNGTPANAFVLNLDMAKSNLAESPDWPILVKNLVDLCRNARPGLARWNYRLNEEITFRLEPGREESRDPLTLALGTKSRPLARSGFVEVPPLDEAGVYEVRDGERSMGRFAVNFYDPIESNLAALGPGVRDPVAEIPKFAYRLDDPYSWLVAGAIAAILAAVLSDWFVLRKRS